MNYQLITRSADGYFVHEPMSAEKCLARLAERMEFYSITMRGEVIHYGIFNSDLPSGRYQQVNVEKFTVILPWVMPINIFITN